MRRSMVAARWAGLLVGLVAGWLTLDAGPLGVGTLLGAPVLGVCVLVGVVVGELLGARGRRQRVRVAALEVRRVQDYLPTHLTTAVAVTAFTLCVLLAVTTAMGSEDDMGRPGRRLTQQCSMAMTASHGPWPGSFYSVPLVGVEVLGGVIALVALRSLVLRRRHGTDPVALSADDAQRRRSAAAVVGSLGVLVSLPLAGVALTSAVAMRGIVCRPVAWDVAAMVLVLMALAALGVAGWSAAAILAPSAARPPAALTR